MPPVGTVRRRVLVTGRVQGVGYRMWCKRRADELLLAGSVRNVPDGRVEVIMEGDEASVDALIAWCRHGPRLARVERVEVMDEEPRGLAGFHVGSA